MQATGEYVSMGSEKRKMTDAPGHPVHLYNVFVIPFLIAAGMLLLTGCPAGNYVGTNVCLQCHNGVHAPDRSLFPESAHTAIGCESCHGPGLQHVRNGGRGGLFINPLRGLPPKEARAVCGRCHQQETQDHLNSKHALNGGLTCTDCHDVHAPGRTAPDYKNNALCLECHGPYGFENDAAIRAHTFHNVDPEGTGASRCSICHMPPLDRVNQEDGPRYHGMRPIPPVASNLAAEAGVFPVPPNSCSGIAGCHDGSVDTAPVFNVDFPYDNSVLQIIYDARYGD